MRRIFLISPVWLVILLMTGIAHIGIAEERTMTLEQLEALQRDGELGGEEVARPQKLPDLTKGEPAGEPGKNGQHNWPLGPTGMYGHMVGGPVGDQIEVSSIAPGSPADGVMKWGDVILGVNGKRFAAGQHMGMMLGKAIIESERVVNNGELKLIVWRDHNMLARNAKRDIAGKDVDELINKVASDDSLYDWKSEEEQVKEVRNQNYDEFPIKGELLEITLKLEVMPDYSDTSPYDCPKAKQILENAYKVLEAQFAANKIDASRRGALAALALVASGKSEHRELIREWVRSPKAKQWHPSIADKLDINKPGGYQSWRMSFDGLDAAIYYDATGDEFVLPAVRAYAVHTAKGQAGGGSWGHTFAWPIFNGGELHGMNPGYGALNAAGNRCFMLIALAKKHGVEHSEIDLAIERSSKFFGSYYEKGAVPYGHHGAAASDDSNGKNVGVAFAFKLLGDKEKARWFAQMSSHASFTRRGGHGSGYLWHYTPWAATMMGPKITIASHRNLRWRFTLCRMHDGSFNCHSNYGKENLRNPTATYVMHYSAPMKQTLFSGKDADESMFWTDEEFADLLTMTPGQFNDETLLEKAGPRITERSTDEVFEFLDVFKPKARNWIAKELGNRYKAGEKDILPRLVSLLESDNPRLRSAAARGLMYCGSDATVQHLSKLIPLLRDDEEFVRMRAAEAIARASDDTKAQVALLEATVDGSVETMSPNSLQSTTQGLVFSGDSKLAQTPFESGLDDELVEAALAKLITLDPAGNRPMLGAQKEVWGKDTVVRLAGPLVFAAEHEQIADQMFSSRRRHTLALLERHGYQEAVDAGVSYLRKYQNISRDIRPYVYFKRGNIDAKLLLRHPQASKQYIDDLYRWMLDKPLTIAYARKEEPNIQLYELIAMLEAVEKEQALPSLAEEVSKAFANRLTQADSVDAKAKLCLDELKDPAERNYFRKIEAMKAVVDLMEPGDALSHVLPYVSHEHWRVEDTARALTLRLVKAHGVAHLYEPFEKAEEAQAVGILSVLAESGDNGGRKLAEQALSHPSPSVRGQAAQALFAIAGAESIESIFKLMQTAEDKVVLIGCEKALQSGFAETGLTDRVRSKSIAMLSDAEPMLRETLYWLIAQCGGPESMSVLAAAADTDDEQQFEEVINALSYCPDPAADRVMFELIKANKGTKRVDAVAGSGVRRMLIGEDGIGTRPTDQQLDWAENVLNQTLNDETIAYLGRIKTGRCAFILQKAMRRGAPASAAKAIIAATDDLTKATDKDRKLAESALVDVIEFIEVTYLRGGATDQLQKNKAAWRTYAQWKSISVEAGKNLLKLTKQKKPEPLPEFDDLDLGL